MDDYEIQYDGQYQSILDQFLKFEINNDLFSLRINDILIWERIRQGVFKQILVEKGLEQKNSVASTEGVATYFKTFCQWSKSFYSKNPFYLNSSDFLFIGTSRRKLREDGKWWDIICDPILDTINLEYIYAEPPFRHSHQKPPKTDNIQYLDFITYTSAVQRKLGIVKYEIPEREKQLIHEIESNLNTDFDVEIDFGKKISEEIQKRSSEKWLYERLLKKIDPNIVVIVANISKQTFIESCKELDVPVVELQHGGFGPDHLGYSFPGDRYSSTFPDYLFVFGQFWKESVDFPIADNHVYPVGYPYLEEERTKFETKKDGEDILFISQPTTGEYISKLASRFAERNGNFTTKYKLHPKEYHCWEEYYPWLKNSDIIVIDDDSTPLYKLLSQAQAQVGVNSTVLSEGLIFNLSTYIINAPGHERLSHLIDQEVVSVISSVSDLENELDKSKKNTELDIDYLFEPNPIENIEEAFEDIIKKHN
jgi:hypothetical protein